jgi:putative membrane protein
LYQPEGRVNKRRGIVVLAAAAALLYAIAARANTGVRPVQYAPDAARTAGRLPPEALQERGFIKQAAAQSRFEAEAARLALDKAADVRLRSYASQVVRDHDNIHIDLVRLLHAREMALPMLDNEHRKILKRLGRLGGRKFEREYMELVGQRMPRQGIRQYELALVASRDPVLKAWIDRRLPAMRERLLQAEQIVPAGLRATGRAVYKSPAAATAPEPGDARPQPISDRGSHSR